MNRKQNFSGRCLCGLTASVTQLQRHWVLLTGTTTLSVSMSSVLKPTPMLVVGVKNNFELGAVPPKWRKRVKVEPSTGCWLWTGAKLPNGYSSISVRLGFQNYRSEYGHRLFYELFKGKIPRGLCVDHLCRVRHCVNPDHLEIVTHKENSLRGNCGFKNASKTHCSNGHPYTMDNTYVYATKAGGKHRQCRICALKKSWERNHGKGTWVDDSDL